MLGHDYSEEMRYNPPATNVLRNMAKEAEWMRNRMAAILAAYPELRMKRPTPEEQATELLAAYPDHPKVDSEFMKRRRAASRAKCYSNTPPLVQDDIPRW